MKTKVKELYSETTYYPSPDTWPQTRYEMRLTRTWNVAVIHMEVFYQEKGGWPGYRGQHKRTIIDLYEERLNDASLIRRAIAAFDDFVLTAPLNYSEQEQLIGEKQ